MPYLPIHIDFAPGEEYQARYRFWQGCPTLVRTPRGRLFAGWYSGGITEPSEKNYNLLVRSDDDGWTWSRPELVVPSEPQNGFLAIDIQLWLDPLERMWLFIVQRYIGGDRRQTDADHLATWATICDNPDADTLQWSQPRFISQGFLRTKPTVLSNGDWVMCAYDWSSPNFRYSRSGDEGKTWVRCEAGRKLGAGFDETMILERLDHSLLMYARVHKPYIVKCTSPDLKGATWSDGEYTQILNADSRFFLQRLKSGRVLLINNESDTHRTNLRAKLSEDDGETWKYSIHLDDAANRAQNVSYPDAAQAGDGRIFVIYDCGRKTFKEIRMAQFTEEDIMAGTLTDHDSYFRRIICKAPGKPYDEKYFEKENLHQDDWFKNVFMRLARPQDAK